jgi:hypothetical protein
VLSGGSLTLDGPQSGQHVNLPTSLLQGLESATFELWVSVTAYPEGVSSGDERILDFGNTTQSSESNISITIRRQTYWHGRVDYTGAGNRIARSDAYASSTLFPADRPVHVALVADSPGERLTLYLDGSEVASGVLDDADGNPILVGDISDEHCWLGRSKYGSFEDFAGVLHEFRIYSSARSAAELANSFALGPDVVPAE